MSQDRLTLFEKVTTGKLMEAISKSMDDFLYIFDIQNSKLELSEAAVDRFTVSYTHLSQIVGYSNPSYFSRAFRSKKGYSPQQYRNRMRAVSYTHLGIESAYLHVHVNLMSWTI